MSPCRNTYNIVRPHPVHELQTIAMDDGGHLSVCHEDSCGFAVQNWLNYSRFCLGKRLLATHKIGMPVSSTDSMGPSPYYFCHLFCMFIGSRDKKHASQSLIGQQGKHFQVTISMEKYARSCFLTVFRHDKSWDFLSVNMFGAWSIMTY